MTRTRAWPVRAMYMLIAAALVISLIIVAAPAHRVSAAPGDDVKAEWEMVATPSMDGWVLAPESVIIDYALAAAGEVAYAVVQAFDEDPSDDEGDPWTEYEYRLLKSDDHGATWTDITKGIKKEIEDENLGELDELIQVATDWVDPDFVAVALEIGGASLHVFFSTDGGTTFIDAGEVTDGSVVLGGGGVSDLAVSYEAAGKRDIAIGGVMCCPDAALFRCTVTGDSPGAWKDATGYDGWDDEGGFNSWLVTDIIFSPNWATDKTILVTTVAYSSGPGPYDVYLQSGSWGISPGWNEKSTLGIEAVPIKVGVPLPDWLTGLDARAIAGITLPEDYNSKNTDQRLLWVWVNYYNISPWEPRCDIVRVDNDSAGLVGPLGQIQEGKIWLTNISYQGTIAEGKAIAGVLGTGTSFDSPWELITECCKGVQVYRNFDIRNMDICCDRWKKACKPPTGNTAMAVSYVGNNKAYAVALQGIFDYDEGAWSVTFDDGDTWNQLSLIDTWIDYLSDVAVSPDCNKTMLVSVNLMEGEREGWCGCDSVWLHASVNLPEAPEYTGQWIRTWCGLLTDDNEAPFWEHGFLRLNPEEDTGETVFLVDRMSNNVYWNDLETLACWQPIACTALDEIVDLAVKDASTLYALDANGDVAMFDGDEWHEAVDSELDAGFTIAVHGDYILVGGVDGDVSYSADGEWEDVTFTELEKATPIKGYVTVAFDSYFDDNNVIYAAVATDELTGGIYLWVLDESTRWTDLLANPSTFQLTGAGSKEDSHKVAYTGIVLDRPSPGNPMTSPATGGVLYASYVANAGNATHPYPVSGVARCLTPLTEIDECVECPAEWDYLIVDLEDDGWDLFFMAPDALKICGCLTADSNSKLFAIGQNLDKAMAEGMWYDMDDGEFGTVWMFEDCYAKKDVDLVSPTDGWLVPADPCDCYNAPFTVKWDRVCDSCVYEIQVATDPDFDHILTPPIALQTPTPAANPYYQVGNILLPGETYYWRVRARIAGTGQEIRSWWSEGRSIMVEPAYGTTVITLITPAPGATDIARTNTGFAWSIGTAADEFDWVLSKNADLSAPIETAMGLDGTAYKCTKTLDYDTTYYWQVTAYKEGVALSVSHVGIFRTVAEEVPPPPVEEPPTPFWVWVIIAIGAVLVIVVIVLIFRTRRV